jgi:hypothetical protein
MKSVRGAESEGGAASTEAVIATPAFVVLVLAAIELIAISWQALSVQIIANQAARDYATWSGCLATQATWRLCTECTKSKRLDCTRPTDLDRVYDTVQTNIVDMLSRRFALNMTTSNTKLTVTRLLQNQAADPCGTLKDIPGTADGRGELFQLRVEFTGNALGLKLFPYTLTGSATAVMEPYGQG